MNYRSEVSAKDKAALEQITRGTMVMECPTGKTFARAYMIAEEHQKLEGSRTSGKWTIPTDAEHERWLADHPDLIAQAELSGRWYVVMFAA